MVFPVKSSGVRSAGSSSFSLSLSNPSVDEKSGVFAIPFIPIDDVDNGRSHEKTTEGTHRNTMAPVRNQPLRVIVYCNLFDIISLIIE
jgi:hypothetical protein